MSESELVRIAAELRDIADRLARLAGVDVSAGAGFEEELRSWEGEFHKLVQRLRDILSKYDVPREYFEECREVLLGALEEVRGRLEWVLA